MAPPKTPKTHDACVAQVEFAPAEVDAGTEITVIVTVACPDGCDLSGLALSIHGEDGEAEIATATLGEANEGQHSTGEFTLKAPPTAGEHSFRVVLESTPRKRTVHELPPTTFTVPVSAHATHINVWGLPSAVAPDEAFSFMVGVKCSAGCTLSGHPLHLSAGENGEVVTAELCEDVWPGTTALHHARVNATAPSSPGVHEWEIVSPETDQGLPHQAGSAKITLNVVQDPDFEVTIQAVDREQQSPIKGARIVMHPYRAVCDDDGFARLKVARGAYRILVSGPRHLPIRQELNVDEDVFTKAELDEEPPPFNPDELYY